MAGADEESGGAVSVIAKIKKAKAKWLETNGFADTVILSRKDFDQLAIDLEKEPKKPLRYDGMEVRFDIWCPDNYVWVGAYPPVPEPCPTCGKM